MSSRFLALTVTAALALSATAADKATTPAATTAPATESATTAKRYGTWGVETSGMDRTAKPGDDFFKYVNGAWVASTQIPPDQTRWGAFNLLRDLSEARVRAIVEAWAANKKLKAGTDEAKVAVVLSHVSRRSDG